MPVQFAACVQRTRSALPTATRVMRTAPLWCRADFHWYVAHRWVAVPRAQRRRRLHPVGDRRHGMVHCFGGRHVHRDETRSAKIPDRAVAKRVDLRGRSNECSLDFLAVRAARSGAEGPNVPIAEDTVPPRNPYTGVSGRTGKRELSPSRQTAGGQHGTPTA